MTARSALGGFIRSSGTRVSELDWDSLTQGDVDSYTNRARVASSTIITIAQFLAEVPGAEAPPMDCTHVLKVVTEDDNEGAVINFELSPAVDMLGGNIGCWCLLPEGEAAMHDNSFRFLAQDNTSTTWRQVGVEPNPNARHRNVWVWCGGNAYYNATDTSVLTTVERLTMNVRANGTAVTAYLTPFKYGFKHRTIFVLEQDDGQIDTGTFFSDLDSYGLVGQLNLIPSSLDAGGGKPTVADVQGFLASGHAICSHGVSNSGVYAGPSSEDNWLDTYNVEGISVLRAAIQHELDTLEDLFSLGDDRFHHALPEGEQNAAVYGVLREKGMKSIRYVGGLNSDDEGVYWEDGGIAGGNYLGCKALTWLNVHTTFAAVDAAIANQIPLQRIYWHAFEATLLAESRALMQYIKDKRDEGLCDVMTFPQFYEMSKRASFARTAV